MPDEAPKHYGLQKQYKPDVFYRIEGGWHWILCAGFVLASAAFGGYGLLVLGMHALTGEITFPSLSQWDAVRHMLIKPQLIFLALASAIIIYFSRKGLNIVWGVGIGMLIYTFYIPVSAMIEPAFWTKVTGQGFLSIITLPLGLILAPIFGLFKGGLFLLVPLMVVGGVFGALYKFIAIRSGVEGQMDV